MHLGFDYQIGTDRAVPSRELVFGTPSPVLRGIIGPMMARRVLPSFDPFAFRVAMLYCFSRCMTATNVVTARGLTKIYRQGEINVTALDNISLDIRAGEFLALMGPSGSGKSTLLHIIAGIDSPTSGECLVQGVDVARLNESELADWRNQNVGFVFQTFNLIPVLTAYENVELPLLLTRLSGRERRTQVMTALELVGLGDRARHLPKQLSGGQEQRVAIARALVTDPNLIVADEPTGNLDSNSAQEVLGILQSLSRNAGKTVIMVTHDPKAAAYGSREVHLEKGRLSNGG
jgi:putative ABC transport system ATP-binding protein